MSGVYIKGMEMPKSCYECGCEQEGGWCGVLEGYTDTKYFDNKRHPNCPLVPVPPHGRLIDAELLLEFVVNLYRRAHGDVRKAYREVLDAICAAEDVIEEEEDAG